MCILCKIIEIEDSILDIRINAIASVHFGQGGLSVAVLGAIVDDIVDNKSPNDAAAVKQARDVYDMLDTHGNAFPDA